MAKAIRTQVAVVQTVNKPVVSLELSEIEAQVLRSLFFRIGGDPTGLRGYTENIDKALAELSVKRTADECVGGAIRFNVTT
jgi:hypothetical protein